MCVGNNAKSDQHPKQILEFSEIPFLFLKFLEISINSLLFLRNPRNSCSNFMKSRFFFEIPENPFLFLKFLKYPSYLRKILVKYQPLLLNLKKTPVHVTVGLPIYGISCIKQSYCIIGFVLFCFLLSMNEVNIKY
jgi:hypothetical protein